MAPRKTRKTHKLADPATTSISLTKLGKKGFANHLHGPPRCTSSNHNKACAKHPGEEVKCVRIAPSIKGIKLEFYSCLHRT